MSNEKFSRGDQIMPGAVPRGLLSTVAPAGSSACLQLLAAIGLPRALSFALMSASTSLRSSRGALKAAARVSVVRSSGVGPKPPVQINTRQRREASSTTSINLSRLSPTTVWRKWGMPSRANSSASQRALPLTMLPSSNSVPMQSSSI